LFEMPHILISVYHSAEHCLFNLLEWSGNGNTFLQDGGQIKVHAKEHRLPQCENIT
jgi:hypothetical protein